MTTDEILKIGKCKCFEEQFESADTSKHLTLCGQLSANAEIVQHAKERRG